MAYRAAVFDLDGTLLNTLADLADSGNELLASYGMAPHPEPAFRYFVGNGSRKLMERIRGMGVDIIPDHADYRLMSSRVLNALEGYGEVNLFLRGIIPQLGFKQSVVYYSRAEREAGTTHYPLSKMMSLAIDGVTSFSIRPLRLITVLGIIVALLSFIGIIYVLVSVISGYYVDGWASTTCILCFVSGIQMISLGVIGEYIGRIYLETKHRPRYFVAERKNLTEE